MDAQICDGEDGSEEFPTGKHDTGNREPCEQGFSRRRWTPRFVMVMPINFVLHSMFASEESSVSIEDGSCRLWSCMCFLAHGSFAIFVYRELGFWQT
ncbi:hypothetical protein L1987_25320 [Smallanthus sonchifolius]|uniref:Uncharacterized protein n=1 Tax=Smallanthus sonchifolius TaxID=185202 RepID=A0ACB9IM90_9ASTR|nr:hypothetical protein L1987_25320 [Smallanthus sonchifolius]